MARLSALRDWTPAQLAAFSFGAWWTLNGVLVFTSSDSSLSTLAAHGKVNALGVSIAVNGWHGLFHLSTGIAGLLACANPKASRGYALLVGSLYLLVAATGFITGEVAMRAIYVDTLGSVIHTTEGLTALAAGLVSARAQRQPDSMAHSR